MQISTVAALPQVRAHGFVGARGMRRARLAGLCLLAVGLAWAGSAGATKYVWEEYDKKLEATQSPLALDSELLGDSVSLQDGALSFSMTDVSVPGNSGLAVEFRRAYAVVDRKDTITDGMLADWSVDLPHVTGTFAPDWVSSGTPGNRCSDQALPPSTVSGFSVRDFWTGLQVHIPGVGGGELLRTGAGSDRPSSEYIWMTNDQIQIKCLTEIANREGTNPASNGEGFLAVTPDGTRYWFNHMARFHVPALKSVRTASQTLPDRITQIFERRKGMLYATRVQDRFGNWVQYHYSNDWNEPGRLTGITAAQADGSDPRSITIEYENDRIARVKEGTRTWHYQYGSAPGGRTTLTGVVLPDASSWEIDFAAFTGAEILLSEFAPDTLFRTCTLAEMPQNIETKPVGMIRHPSGAWGTFQVELIEHGRSYVPVTCGHYTQPHNDENDDVNLFAISGYSFTLTGKEVEGAGLPLAGSSPPAGEETFQEHAPLVWSYAYDYYKGLRYWAGNDGPDLQGDCTNGAACKTFPVCLPQFDANGQPLVDCYKRATCGTGPCEGTAKTTVTGPNGTWVRYTFGNSYKYNEGKLLKVESGSGPSGILETVTHSYDLSLADQVYPASFGTSMAPESYATSFHRPMVRTITTRQGEDFIWEAKKTCGDTGNQYCFDEHAHPRTVERHSSLGHGRTEVTTYQEDSSDWVIGQVETVVCASAGCDGDVIAGTDYDLTTMLPIRQYAFGKLQHTLAYAADGTLASFEDGRGNLTTIGAWSRGIPLSISYEDGTGISATVDTFGSIRSVTNEAGAKTCYHYDVMGRMARIEYPSESNPGQCDVAGLDWNPTVLEFDDDAVAGFGLPANHWWLRAQTGTGVKETHYDAFWRPVAVYEYDSSDTPGTGRHTRFAYDHGGRTTFASYPGTTSGGTAGVRTWYDALGRAVRTAQHSEIGPLESSTEYLAGFLVRTKNHNQAVTTTSYMAFDQPSTDWPEIILHPEDAVTTIDRDSYGKPLSITRSDSALATSLTRAYGYNGHEELCRVAEPETGVTVMHYDAAGNLDWSAGGLSQGTGCNSAIPAGVKVSRQYDARNRLTHLTFPDGNGSQAWDYTPDGLPESVTTYNYEGLDQTSVVNGYAYNARRLPVTETLSQAEPAYTWSLGYDYTPNAHLASHTYPGGLVVPYAPNALGQPTQAGTFAAGVSYFPNGSVQQFTYGNGIVHAMTPNARQLPEHSRAVHGSVEIVDDYYDYDPNGNVLAITDDRAGSGNRGNRDMYYDGLDRLETATSSMFNGTARYTYDVLDNLTAVVAPGRSHLYHYLDGSNRLTSVTDSGSGATVLALGYDAQGNLATKDGSGQMFDFDFDFGNRLRGADGKETYRYDAHGRRIQATAGGGAIRSFYDQGGVLRYQADERRDETVSYVYLAGSLVAEHVEAIAADVPDTAPTIDQPAGNTNATGSYTLGWTSVPDAATYELEQRVGGGAWQVPALHDGTGTSAAVSVTSGGAYGYRVRGCSGGGCGPWSAIKTITVDAPVPATPGLVVPAIGPSGAYAVDWSSEAGTAEYELQESPNGTTGWVVVYQDGVALRKRISGKPAGTYHYRVRACNGDAECSAWSASDSVQVVYPPAACTLSVPATSTTGDYTVTCSSVAGATGYELEERLGGAWSQAYAGASRSHAVADKPAGTFDYRMRACNAAGCSAWSSIGTVQVVLPPAAPTLAAAAQGLHGDYAVSWTEVGGADRYELQERFEGGAWNEVHDGPDNSVAFADRPSGTYDYQVRACNLAGCSAWSAGVTVESIHAPAVAPALTVPAQDADGNYTISWTSVAGATAYRVQETREGDDASFPGPQVPGTSRSYVDKLEGAYEYKVAACNVAGCGPQSSPKTVNVVYGDPEPETPVLTVPAYGYNGDYNITWTAEAHATRYELQEGTSEVYDGAALVKAFLDRAAGTYSYRVRACNADNVCSAWSAYGSVVVIHAPPPCAITAPATSTTGDYTVSWCAVAGADLYKLQESANGGTWVQVQSSASTSRVFVDKPDGAYAYRLQACNEAGCGAFSATKTVIVDRPDPVPDVPVLTVPAYGYNGDYTVAWTAETHATRYELQEGTTEVYDGPALTKVWADRPAGTYDYRVRACNAESACSAWSAYGSVVVIHSPPPCTVTAPATSFSGDYTVSWCAVAGATGYELFESVNSAAWTKVLDSTATSRAFANRPTGSYRYRMRACNQAGCGAYSVIDTVTVRAPDVPALTVPTYGLNGDYTVSWTAETGASGYTLERSANAGGTWAAAYTGTALSIAYVDEPAGTYHFRVKACSDVGCSAWSALDSSVVIYKPTSAPALTVPAQGFSGDYTVSWTSVATANRYELQESANGGTWTEVHDASTRTKAFVDRAIGTYAYRVRACNQAGCSAFSASDSVEVIYPPGAPTLTVPSTDADGDYTISWTAVSGATSYRVQEFYEFDDTWLTSPATTATSKSYVDKLEGSYQYKVYACNAAGCGPTSAVKTLTVLPPPPPPGTPTGLLVEKLLFTNCMVYWNPVVNATSYQVQNGTNIRYDGSGTSYRETSCSGSYRVRACNSTSCSAWSAGVYPSDPQ